MRLRNPIFARDAVGRGNQKAEPLPTPHLPLHFPIRPDLPAHRAPHLPPVFQRDAPGRDLRGQTLRDVPEKGKRGLARAARAGADARARGARSAGGRGGLH